MVCPVYNLVIQLSLYILGGDIFFFKWENTHLLGLFLFETFCECNAKAFSVTHFCD